MLTGCSVLVGSGIRPMKFEKRMKKNRVARNGKYFAAIFASRLSLVIWPRTRSKTPSTAIWVLFGRSCIRFAIQIIAVQVMTDARTM